MDGESGRSSGVLISEGLRANACARLGIRAGDVVLRLNDVEVSGKAEMLTALDAYQGDPAPAVPPRIVLGRGAETVALEYVYEEPAAEEERVTLKRSEAEALLKDAQAAVQSDLENIVQVNREKAALRGDSAQDGDRLSGLWLPGPLNPEHKKTFLMLGLADGDRLTRIDGEPVTGVAQLQKTIESVLARVASSEKKTLSLMLDRGELTTLTKVIIIE
jgi:S1-C subfamily serine protease